MRPVRGLSGHCEPGGAAAREGSRGRPKGGRFGTRGREHFIMQPRTNAPLLATVAMRPPPGWGGRAIRAGRPDRRLRYAPPRTFPPSRKADGRPPVTEPSMQVRPSEPDRPVRGFAPKGPRRLRVGRIAVEADVPQKPRVEARQRAALGANLAPEGEARQQRGGARRGGEASEGGRGVDADHDDLHHKN
jgi:hypothetical protein